MKIEQKEIKLLDKYLELSLDKYSQQESRLNQTVINALKGFNRKTANRNFNRLLEYNGLRELFENCRELVSQSENKVYAVDSWLLRDVVNQLGKGINEHICLLTGIEINGLKILSRISHVEYNEQSPVFAQSTIQSSSDALIEMEENGNKLHVIAHSHPGRGASATNPSNTDTTDLGRIQKAGSEAIGLIIVRDGYCRFFSAHHPFKIYVTGKGVKQVDENVFKVDLQSSKNQGKNLIHRLLT